MFLGMRDYKWIVKSKSDMLEFVIAICSIILAIVMILDTSESDILHVDEGYLASYLFIAGILSFVRLFWPVKPKLIVSLTSRGLLSFSFLVLLISINWTSFLTVSILFLLALSSLVSLLIDRI